jgi:Rieske 2Fe-2S family protein
MGQLRRFDGGVSGFRFQPFVYVAALNDHAVMFQFLPTGPETTDVILSWLVGASAAVADIDVDRMIWFWDVTTTQDKTIIERNAAGVRSRAYAPGPYSTLECNTARFVSRYLQELSARSRAVQSDLQTREHS